MLLETVSLPLGPGLSLLAEGLVLKTIFLSEPDVSCLSVLKVLLLLWSLNATI